MRGIAIARGGYCSDTGSRASSAAAAAGAPGEALRDGLRRSPLELAADFPTRPRAGDPADR